MSTIDESLNEIESGDGMNIIQMFDDLSQDIVGYSFSIIKRMKKGGSGMMPEEKKWLDEAQYQLEIINKTLQKVRKAGRLVDDKPNEKYTEELREKIREAVKNPIVSSSVAPIVAMVPVHKIEEESKEKKVK